MALLQRYKGTTAGKANEKAISDGIREVDNVRMNIQLKDKRDIGSGTGRFEMPSLPKLPVKQCLAGLAVVAVLGAGYVAIPKAIDYVKNLPSEPKQEEKAAASAEQNTAKAPLDKVVVEMEASGSCWTEILWYPSSTAWSQKNLTCGMKCTIMRLCTTKVAAGR